MDAPTVLRRADLNLIPALAALLDQRHMTRAAQAIGAAIRRTARGSI
jgi:hypothetical protein